MTVEYRMLVSETLGNKRAALMATLKEHDVKPVIVTCGGIGDSGGADGVKETPYKAIKAQESTSITGLICL